jgi:hypothetical protein
MSTSSATWRVGHQEVSWKPSSAENIKQQITVRTLHVCTVHQQYQSTFYCSTMMHTIIKSQAY